MTRIEEAQEQLFGHRKVAPLDQGAAVQWVETHDGIEQEISHLNAETLGDVLIKLDVVMRLDPLHSGPLIKWRHRSNRVLEVSTPISSVTSRRRLL